MQLVVIVVVQVPTVIVRVIGRPDWIESSAGRTSFLWYCRACDYQFEAIAIYEESHPDALAA